MLQETSSTNGCSLRKRLAHVPRLSIRYLLFTTAVTAATLSLIRLLGGSPARMELVNLAMLVPLMLIFSWTAAAALLIGWHAARRTLWPLEPGEWAVLAGFVVTALLLAQPYVFNFVVDLLITENHLQYRTLNPGEGIRLFFLMQAVSQGIMAIPYAAAAVTQRRRRWWLAYFALLSVALTGSFLMSLSIWFRDLGNFPDLRAWSVLEILFVIAALVMLTIAVVMDRHRREPRHWLHLSGVSLTALSLVMLLAGLVMRW